MSLIVKILGAIKTIITIFAISLVLLIVIEVILSVLPSGNPKNLSKSVETRPAPAPGYWGEHDPYTTEWHPYVYWRHEPFRGIYINVSDQGLRRTWNRPTENAGNRFTIWCFGGSTMWGVGARDDFTIPSQISKILSDRFPGVQVEVTNFAESAYVSTQELIALYLQVREGEMPNLVIFLDGANDVYSGYYNAAAGLPLWEWERKKDFNMGKRFRRLTHDKAALAQFFLKATAVYHWAKRQVGWGRETLVERDLSPGERTQFSDAKLLQLAESIWQSYRFNVSAIQEFCRPRQIPTLFYWQPVSYVTKSASIQAASEGSPLQQLYQKTYALARTCELPVFRYLGDAFDDYTENFLIDFCHLNEKGHEIIAQRMVTDIAPLIPGAGRSDADSHRPCIEDTRYTRFPEGSASTP